MYVSVLVLVSVPVLVPTELTEYTEAYGLRNLNPQNSLRFARQEFTELKGIWNGDDRDSYRTEGYILPAIISVASVV